MVLPAVKSSNTEPIVRVLAEAKDEAAGARNSRARTKSQWLLTVARPLTASADPYAELAPPPL
jgi:hypothetical protein